ncbi:MAG: phosphate signaling complex protein PhoU [Gemmatimonadota bacterium]
MSPTSGARHLSDDLETLKARLLEMSVMVEDLLRIAVESLAERDEVKARSVEEGDRSVDAIELELDEASINMLALHQPVARDLRLITMAMRISSDLERIGDHAVNVAQAVKHVGKYPTLGRFPELGEMARLTRQMLTDALDAFTRGDAALARDVRRRDDRVDALQDSLIRILLTHMMEDPRRIGSAISLLLVSRNLERVADLATNISEDVVFMVEGRFIKHGGPAAAGKDAADQSPPVAEGPVS